MKHKTVILLIALMPLFSLIKGQESFNSLISALKGEVKTVNSAKLVYEQEINIEQPGVINFVLTTIDQKGTQVKYNNKLNFADLDPIMVREVTEKEKIFVQLKVENDQKLISCTKDGEFDGYENIVKIYAENIDNARAIKEKVLAVIPVAKEIMKNRFNLETYDEQLTWLVDNIGDVTVSDKTHQQILQVDKTTKGAVNLEVVETTSKLTKSTRYQFNLADINPNSLNFKISGAYFSVEFETNRKQKLIKTYIDGEQGNYNYDLKILAYSVENARDLKYILDKIIPLAEQEVSNALPQINSVQDATSLLSTEVKEVIINDVTNTQKINNDCKAKLDVVVDDMKKKTESSFEFNLSDINEHSLDYKILGKKFQIVFQTKGGYKLIKAYKDQEQQNFDDDGSILCDDGENARLIMHALKKGIPLCEAAIVRLVPEENLAAKVSWLIEHTVEVTFEAKTINQKLERIENDDHNKLRLMITEITEKKSVEYIYEFNLSDLNPNSVEYDIKGKELSIVLNTNYNAKVIKTYEDGELQNYTNKINIYANDIDLARNLILGLKESIEENSK
jgi:hypothetical protein